VRVFEGAAFAGGDGAGDSAVEDVSRVWFGEYVAVDLVPELRGEGEQSSWRLAEVRRLALFVV
jgi:hypothetical protein